VQPGTRMSSRFNKRGTSIVPSIKLTIINNILPESPDHHRRPQLPPRTHIISTYGIITIIIVYNNINIIHTKG